MSEDVKVVTLIRTSLTLRGDGKSEETPFRKVTQYWDLEGNLIFEIDPVGIHPLGYRGEIEEK